MKTRGTLKKKANIALISQVEPKKIEEVLKDSSWVQAMQEELDQFGKNQVWKLIPKPENVSVIGTKWVFRNKLNEDGKEGVDYDETFALVARLESIRILLAYASFKGFRLFQMNVKSAFLNGFIEEEVYVKQPPGFVDSKFPYHTKYTKKLIQKFGMSNAKSIGTPMSPLTSLDKDEQGIPIDETKYCGMIGSLLYLTASRSDIMFSVCKCARFQLAPKKSNLTAVKRIIRYLTGTVSHGLSYPCSNSFKLEGFSDADLTSDKM
uniref:Uncharacterized protein LOC104241107 n=1 Tax=Nicotiana sylvestris TaxID=4096 RepID=A0A1U7Y6A6_NICSY|nr:PREDICTED: uncharacterized protein LOC104241107 [Nicotiana sylvestris]